jgi:hypothetical protein
MFKPTIWLYVCRSDDIIKKVLSSFSFKKLQQLVYKECGIEIDSTSEDVYMGKMDMRDVYVFETPKFRQWNPLEHFYPDANKPRHFEDHISTITEKSRFIKKNRLYHIIEEFKLIPIKPHNHRAISDVITEWGNQ